MLIALAPLRDRRERVVGYQLHAHAPNPETGRLGAVGVMPALHARELLEFVPALGRLAGETLLVPTTPGLVHDGSLQRLDHLDVVWIIQAEELVEPSLRREMLRQVGGGLHFAIDGFPEGERLPEAFAESLVVLNAATLSPAMLEIRGRMLVESGLRPMVVGVDDRVTRQRAMQAGAQVIGGRPLTRGAAIAPDRSTEDSIFRVINVLARFAEATTPDASFDTFIREDPYIATSLLKTISSAAIGVRTARSVEHAIQLIGREAVVERMLLVTGRMIGEVGGDHELAAMALRRARVCELVGPRVEPTAQQRTLQLAGLLSTLEWALGRPADTIVSRLTLPPRLADVLVHREGRLGLLVDALDAYECGWWPSVEERCQQLALPPSTMGDIWIESWRWARDELAAGRGDFL
jgi:EAL and modified HD-GYP domain-containing signal transduction protein